MIDACARFIEEGRVLNFAVKCGHESWLCDWKTTRSRRKCTVPMNAMLLKKLFHLSNETGWFDPMMTTGCSNGATMRLISSCNTPCFVKVVALSGVSLRCSFLRG